MSANSPTATAASSAARPAYILVVGSQLATESCRRLLPSCARSPSIITTHYRPPSHSPSVRPSVRRVLHRHRAAKLPCDARGTPSCAALSPQEHGFSPCESLLPCVLLHPPRWCPVTNKQAAAWGAHVGASDARSRPCPRTVTTRGRSRYSPRYRAEKGSSRPPWPAQSLHAAIMPRTLWRLRGIDEKRE